VRLDRHASPPLRWQFAFHRSVASAWIQSYWLASSRGE
jgi:hypothetical protein